MLALSLLTDSVLYSAISSALLIRPMVHSIMKIPENQQALFGQHAVHALIVPSGGNAPYKLALHAESHSVHPAFSARGRLASF
jgi:hypothetical protein